MAIRWVVLRLSDPISWGGIIGGVFVALVIHILLNLLGAGIGFAAIDRATTQDTLQELSWTVFAWWSVSGIISAFVGGWAAASLAGSLTHQDGAIHGFLSWTVTTVAIVVLTGLAAGTTATATGALITPLSPSALRPGGITIAETAFATLMLVSFVALLVGALAATIGGRLGVHDEAVRPSKRGNR